MEPAVIAVVGGKSSGKTTAVEALTKELTRRGYRVAAVKHVPEKDFTIDTKDKDTWRFAQSGAKTVVCIAPNEITTIQKTSTESITIEDILARCRGSDIVIIEGFRNLVSKDRKVPKIVTVKSEEEAIQASKIFSPIIAFTGPYTPTKSALNAPYINVFRGISKIADMVEEFLKRKKDLESAPNSGV
ncbi:MAG: molybdopterin-guanine dinucleotide biosynthesis protein B [Candidatus Bathyarchaeia archaeon]